MPQAWLLRLQLLSGRVADVIRRLRPDVLPPFVVQPRHLLHASIVALSILSAIASRTMTVSDPLAGTYGAVEPPAVVQVEDQAGPSYPPDLYGSGPKSIGLALVEGNRLESSPGKPAPADKKEDPSASGKPRTLLKYTVEEGDTLLGIAERFAISGETVRWANEMADPDSLQVGDELVILPVSGVLHTVASGDNVNELALSYDVTPESIVEFNGISDADMLQLGDKLVVPGGKILPGGPNRPSQAARSAPAPSAASGSFRWPTGGYISQYFGEGGHSGLDLATQQGSPVYAADGGVVVTALKLSTGYGWHLIVDHGNGYRTLYSHLSAFHVDYGERVGKGETIGLVGSTGLSTGPHLHFEIFQNGARVNPLKFLP